MRRYPFFTSLTIASLIISSACTPNLPNFHSVRARNAIDDRAKLNRNVKLSGEALTLDEIVGVALCRNLDVQLQEIEQMVYNENYVAEKLRQLPQLIANGEYSHRDNTPAWFSQPIGGTVGPLPTQSNEKDTKAFDLTAAYNILDFGLTYIKTRQEKSRACLKRQQHLRARQNLILDINRAYYRAVVAKQARSKSKRLIGILEKRQLDLKRQMKLQLVSEMRGLINDNRLIDMKTRLLAFENEYRSAMAELSALMGLPPGCPFEIADVEAISVTDPEINVCEMEKIAFRARPELIAQDIQVHIDCDEVKASILRKFPNVKLFGSWYYDDDRFNFHNNWVVVGAHMTWDLLSIPSKWKDYLADQYQAKHAEATRLSMSMGILTQVHLANINVHETFMQYQMADELNRVKGRQLEVARLFEVKGEYDVDDIIAYQVESLFAEVNQLKAYTNHLVAMEQLGNAIGQPMSIRAEPGVPSTDFMNEKVGSDWEIEDVNGADVPMGTQPLVPEVLPAEIPRFEPPPPGRIQKRLGEPVKQTKPAVVDPKAKEIEQLRDEVKELIEQEEDAGTRVNRILKRLERSVDEIYKEEEASPWQFQNKEE